MKKRILATALCSALLLPMLFSFAACGKKDPGQKSSLRDNAGSVDLMAPVQAKAVQPAPDSLGTGSAAATEFAVKLFQNSLEDGKNTLVSPLSVLCALAMTANGAKGETRAQMEAVLGLPVAKLNEYLYAYRKALPAAEQYKLDLANAIWFKDDESFSVDPAFLQSNADWYGAGAYKAPFDATTLDDVNAWVREHTDGMIEKILDQIPDDAVIYLVNALAFDAEWASIYRKDQVRDGSFTTEDGTARKVELMYSAERQYLQDENASGFIKYYADHKYAFAALLPDEGVSVADYCASLTGERLADVLSSAQSVQVNAAIPKFESEYSVEMSQILQNMGMTDAFDSRVSDFSGIGTSTEGNLCISRVLHKTFIAVNERGTKAGAATAVEMVAESAMAPTEEKTVYLDRPFVYMLIDCQTNLPVFIGAVMDVDA